MTTGSTDVVVGGSLNNVTSFSLSTKSSIILHFGVTGRLIAVGPIKDVVAGAFAIPDLTAFTGTLANGTEVAIGSGGSTFKTTLQAIRNFFHPPAAVYRRYLAIKPEADGATIGASDFIHATRGATSQSSTITMPTFTGNHYLAVLLPQDHGAPSTFRERNSLLNFAHTLYLQSGVIRLSNINYLEYRYGSSATVASVVTDVLSGQEWVLS